MTDPGVVAVLAAKIPLWQAVLLGGTSFLAGRLLQRGLGRGAAGARAVHATSSSRSSNRSKGLGGEDVKLVLVVRMDLGMSKGKIAAQCSHAALACYKDASRRAAAAVSAWEVTGQAKVVLRCESEDELMELQGKARSAGLVAQSIRDAGRTQIAAGSRTVLGIGPGPASLIDRITGDLRLY
ncbi:hypothetical protein H4R18_000474 [Coemansia javaensis]|uniref:peptidyl-tRNA hydrolase n=1 Tax=Coemansia javaensis TaxID=2761396 RepID=A0A9W8HGN8_9FUNG|nr:hypothetical protein H4R18_000474 [Coemansia javaensis]